MERFWFTIDFAGLDVAWPWSEEDPHGCFPIEPGDTVDGLLIEETARHLGHLDLLRESTDGLVGE